jgi:hypothetical protein
MLVFAALIINIKTDNMKSIKIVSAGLGLLLIMASCTKKAEPVLQISQDFTNATRVKLYNAVVNSTRNYLYIDGKAVNGATIAYGATFPSAAYAFIVEPGLKSFVLKDTLVTSTQVPLTFSENMQVNSLYSVFAYDTITSVKQKTVPTVIEIPTDTTARIRFANFGHSKTAVPAIDIYSIKRKANVFSNVSTNEVSSYIPYASALSDTLVFRAAGTTTTLIQVNGFNPTQRRSYTLLLRGSYNPSAIAANKVTLSVHTDY